MKYLRHFSCLIFLSFLSNMSMADIGCAGAVNVVMEWPGQCEGRLAYMSNANNNKWVCTLSAKSESIVLAAVASGLKITTVFDDSVATSCATIDAHYQTPRYIMIRNDN